jgi:hypothetical protein
MTTFSDREICDVRVRVRSLIPRRIRRFQLSGR